MVTLSYSTSYMYIIVTIKKHLQFDDFLPVPRKFNDYCTTLLGAENIPNSTQCQAKVSVNLSGWGGKKMDICHSILQGR